MPTEHEFVAEAKKASNAPQAGEAASLTAAPPPLDQERLVIVVCSPRSGSTMLQRMLGSHPQIHATPETHMLVPLNYLGYYETLDSAPYDLINTTQAFREFTQALPGGEADYLDSLRAYTSSIYGRVLAPTGKHLFSEKTPANALVLPFITRLYPHARYVVLTRHPLAIMASVAHTFFKGDMAMACASDLAISRFVPAIGRFLEEKTVPFVHLRYEDLVTQPETAMHAVCEHLGLDYDDRMIDYGRQQHTNTSFGDPIGVSQHDRPVTDSLNRWVREIAADPGGAECLRNITRELDDGHLEAWGYPRGSLWSPLEVAPGSNDLPDTNTPRRRRPSVYRLKRIGIVRLRKNIHQNTFGKVVKRLRYYCDVLLRS